MPAVVRVETFVAAGIRKPSQSLPIRFRRHVRIGQERTVKATRCAAVNPALAAYTGKD